MRPSLRRCRHARHYLPIAILVFAFAMPPGHATAQLPGGASTAHAPHVAYRVEGAPAVGTCNTGIQVQNTDVSNPADVEMRLYPQAGGAPPILRPFPPVPAGGAASYYLPAMPPIDPGVYAAILSSDGPELAALARTDCTGPDGVKSAMYGQSIPTVDAVVPLFVKDYYGQCSVVSIQNTDTTSSAVARLEVHETGAEAAVATVEREIGPGTSVTVNPCRDASPGDVLPDGLLGSVRVQSDTPLAVQSYVDIVASRKALYAFEGVPAESAERELFVPLFRKRQRLSGGHHMDTGISVVNPGSTPADVTVEYFGADAPGLPEACRGNRFLEGPLTVAPFSSRVFYLGPRVDPPCPGGCVPDNCVGSARISASQPVLAVVNESLDLTAESAAYNAFPRSWADTTVAVPLFRAGHTSWKLFTGVSVMNLGSEAANVRLDAVSASGRDRISMEVSDVQPLHTALFWPPEGSRGDWANSNSAYGSAVVSSDQPVAVIVNDVSMTGSADGAIYAGIAIGVED